MLRLKGPLGKELQGLYRESLQAALKRLLAAAGGGGGGGSGGKGAGSSKDAAALSTARVAVRCLAGLLVSLPHFNYASDLLQVRLRTNPAF